MGYTKLFSSIISSTIWDEDSDTCKVWITFLALAEFDGAVMASVPGIAHLARVSRDAAEAAIAKLQSPDVHSRTSFYDGRRIERVEGGWKILNHTFYQRLMSREERNQRQAEYMRRRRSGGVIVVHETSIPQTKVPQNEQCRQMLPMLHTHTHTHTHTKTNKNKSAALPDWLPLDSWQGFAEFRARMKKPLLGRTLTLNLNTLTKLRAAGEDPAAVLDQSVERGWTGLFAVHNGKSLNGPKPPVPPNPAEETRKRRGVMPNA